VNLLLRELLIFNAIALLTAFIIFLIGWDLINAIIVSFLLLSALLFIGGGAIGFFLSSSSFETLQKFFRRKTDESVDQVKNEKKEKIVINRERVNVAKRMLLIGSILFGESLLISILLIL